MLKLLQITIFLLFNSYAPYQTVIGRGARVGRRGIGGIINKEASIINKEAFIGEGALIRALATIGKKASQGYAPRIGNGVILGDGAKVLGDLRIGGGAVSAVNVASLKDKPLGRTFAGMPAKSLGGG